MLKGKLEEYSMKKNERSSIKYDNGLFETFFFLVCNLLRKDFASKGYRKYLNRSYSKLLIEEQIYCLPVITKVEGLTPTHLIWWNGLSCTNFLATWVEFSFTYGSPNCTSNFTFG